MKLKLLILSEYAQAERNDGMGIRPDKLQLEFAQRYVYSGCWRKENWMDYLKRKKFKLYGGIGNGA